MARKKRERNKSEHYTKNKICSLCSVLISNNAIHCPSCSNKINKRGVAKTRIGTVTAEHAKNISTAHTGKKLSKEHKKSLSISKKGSKHTEKTLKKMRGRKLSKETKLKMSIAKQGHKTSVESRKKISKANKGENSYLWKGGISGKNEKARRGLKFRLWREKIFRRDDYTCQECDVRGGKLQPHHIKSFALFTKLRFEISNGTTLCEECHKKTENYGGKANRVYVKMETTS